MVARRLSCGTKSGHLQLPYFYHRELWPNRLATWLLLTAYNTHQCSRIRLYHRRLSADTCSLEIGEPTPNNCMTHYAQTASAHWLLLTGYRHLKIALFNFSTADPSLPCKQGYILLAFGHRRTVGLS